MHDNTFHLGVVRTVGSRCRHASAGSQDHQNYALPFHFARTNNKARGPQATGTCLACWWNRGTYVCSTVLVGRAVSLVSPHVRSYADILACILGVLLCFMPRRHKQRSHVSKTVLLNVLNYVLKTMFRCTPQTRKHCQVFHLAS